MTTDEAIKQAQSELSSVREMQAENIAWCLVQQLRPEMTRDEIQRMVEPLMLEIERVLR
jgi:hypothetical protein